MFKWKKLGQVFFTKEHSGQDWFDEFAQAPSTLLFDDFVRVYFSCRSKRDPQGNCVSYTAYVDLDRADLSKVLRISKEPVLPLGKKGCFDEFGIYPMSVIRTNDEVWAYYAGWTRCESVPLNTAIGYAKSNDGGKSFERLGDGPVLSYSPCEPFVTSGPKIRFFNGLYYLFYISGDEWFYVDGRPEISCKIRVATSEDGINWNKLGKSIIPWSISEREAQASPDVFYANGIYHMFFCHWDPLTFRQTKSRKIAYAYSKDLINWTRDDGKSGMSCSDSGFDSEMQAYPHLFELDGKVYMLYLGNEVGRYGFGLAELQGDLSL